jgi:hypothetical protein
MKKLISALWVAATLSVPAYANNVLSSKDFTLTVEDAQASAVAAPCVAAGGTVVDAAGTEICQFTATYCPAGWSQHQSWSTWASHSQTFHGYYGLADWLCTSQNSLYYNWTLHTPVRDWSNTAGNPWTQQYLYHWSNCNAWPPYLGVVTAPVTKRTQIGCLPN